MVRIGRRRFLKFSGAATVAARTAGIAGILASSRAPAYGQTTSLQWLKFVDFVPVSDQLLRGKITEECQKALGIKLNIETIEGNGIQPRITSAIQSSTVPTSSWRSTTGRSSTATASLMSARLQRRLAMPWAGIT